jgi:hypothetical protein
VNGDPQRDEYFIRAAFQRILSRDARAEERDASVEFLREQAAAIRSSEASSPAEPAAKTAEAAPPSLNASQRARVDFVHALFNHHDFVNIR